MTIDAHGVEALPVARHPRPNRPSVRRREGDGWVDQWLAAGGPIYLDGRAHKTIHDACAVARGLGATVRRFRHDDVEQLEDMLREDRAPQALICMDGLNSMTGNAPDLRAFAGLAREH